MDAATPSATITVDAGTYNEQVFLTKSLTIKGAKAGVDARTRATTGETIMGGISANGAQTGSFFVTADNVTIDGFTVQGETNKSTTRGAGIVIYPNVSGTHVFNNILQNNVAGLFLANASSTNAAVIQHNLFKNNNNAGVNGGPRHLQRRRHRWQLADQCRHRCQHLHRQPRRQRHHHAGSGRCHRAPDGGPAVQHHHHQQHVHRQR